MKLETYSAVYFNLFYPADENNPFVTIFIVIFKLGRWLHVPIRYFLNFNDPYLCARCFTRGKPFMQLQACAMYYFLF